MKKNVKTACLFGGHGSQYRGMGKHFYEHSEECRRIFNIGTSILDYDVAEYCFYGVNDESIDQPFYSLTSLLVVDLCAYTMALNDHYTFDAYAGFSLGEYAALTASGAISIHQSFELLKDVLLIVDSFPQEESYSMSVVNLPPEICEDLCVKVRRMNEKVVVSNYNTHNQVTIAGTVQGLEHFKALSDQFEAKMVPISIHRAFHTEFLSSLHNDLKREVDKFDFDIPRTPLFMNASGKEVTTIEELKSNIICHFTTPVLWSQSLMNMFNSGIERFIECGTRGVLSKMAQNNLGIEREAAYHISHKVLSPKELQL